jgi:hypothetical protein
MRHPVGEFAFERHRPARARLWSTAAFCIRRGLCPSLSLSVTVAAVTTSRSTPSGHRPAARHAACSAAVAQPATTDAGKALVYDLDLQASTSLTVRPHRGSARSVVQVRRGWPEAIERAGPDVEHWLSASPGLDGITVPASPSGAKHSPLSHIPRGKTGKWGMFQPPPTGMSINFGMRRRYDCRRQPATTVARGRD